MPIRTTAGKSIGVGYVSTRPLLSINDFSYLGHYLLDGHNRGMAFGRGITHRYVSGHLRFLTFGYDAPGSPIIEFQLPNNNFDGSEITNFTNSWDEIFSPAGTGPNIGGGDEFGLWWEDLGGGTGRLWTSQAQDYPDDPSPPDSNTGTNDPFSVCIRSLNSNGTISNFKGPYGFDSVGQRAISSGVRAIPSWFQSQYNTGPYVYGFGGYTSRMAQGLTPSLGLMLIAGPDVTGIANPNTPILNYKIMADHRSGTTNASDWYISPGTPATFDRGERNPNVINEYDGGQWLSPAPDGFGRWVWGDTFDGAAVWIDGPIKQGFIAIGSFAHGRAFYQNSSLNCDSVDAELQIFSPYDFAAVLNNTENSWNVQPIYTGLLNANIGAVTGALGAQGGSTKAIAGATFDTTTNILWLWYPNYDNDYGCALYAYSVNVGALIPSSSGNADSTASGVGKTLNASHYTAAGSSTALFIPFGGIIGTGSGTGISTANGITIQIRRSNGTSSSPCSVTSIGSSFNSSQYSFLGDSTASAYPLGMAMGNVIGDSNAFAIGIKIISSIGNINADSSASAIKFSISVGNISGDSDASADGIIIKIVSATGIINADSNMTGVGRKLIFPPQRIPIIKGKKSLPFDCNGRSVYMRRFGKAYLSGVTVCELIYDKLLLPTNAS